MRKNNKISIILLSVLFVAVFAFVVPLIVFPVRKIPQYEMYETVAEVRAFLETEAQDVTDEGQDPYLGSRETSDSLNISFTYGGKRFSLSAHVFVSAEDCREYYAAKSGYASDAESNATANTYYFSATYYAYDGSRSFCLTGSDYLMFTNLISAMNEAQGGRENV